MRTSGRQIQRQLSQFEVPRRRFSSWRSFGAWGQGPAAPQRVSDATVRTAIRLARRRPRRYRLAFVDALPQPNLRIPPELPIAEHADAIRQALDRHPVLIVAGATGSGKTTQLPKLALAAGRGQDRIIGCTQPRRLATLTVARRVAEELGVPLGAQVGYQHRYERRVSEATRVKFMTDGVLLAETRRDPLLRAYDTLIIDEAHERSLNIDLLLGLLKRLLTQRRDLRVIVSSATLDPARFAAFFGDAPVLHIAGRTYPIEIRYRPPADGDDADLPRLVTDALAEIDSAGAAGDTLVFLPGERDIREVADALANRRLPDTELIPLLASSPAADQQRAFQSGPRRRVVLATNVAETSITIPGIRYVIDSGLARISRYVHRTQVQRLHVEPISQASANQRAGRCGRVAPGLCIRLFSAEDFAGRDPFTDPEVLRTSLAGVVLTMLDLRLGRIEDFPFLDPPAPALIRDGFRELEELGAVDATGRLTPLGRRLARLPVEPRLARMLLAAHEERTLQEALIVVAALEADDPRRRPIDQQAAADAAHARFQTPTSDFAALIRLWRWYDEAAARQPQRTARRLCQEHFLSYPRMREWRELRDQLARLCRTLELNPEQTGGGDDALHRALLAGLLGRIGQRDPETGDYRGARALRFSLHPGSGLARKPPAWIMAGELVDTARLYARQAAAIDPTWIEALAGDLCKHSYHSPSWDAEAGFVRAVERVTLYGLVIVEGRRRDYTRINPAACREIFIHRALVAGELPRPPPFLAHNLRLLTTLEQTAHKLRCAPRLPDPDELAAFYEARLPAGLCTVHELRRWLQYAATSAEQKALELDAEQLLEPDDRAVGFPARMRVGEHEFALSYRHAPREADDGITCTVPRRLLPVLRAWRADWLVPGALPEKVRWMLAALPPRQRRLLLPLDETAAACLPRLGASREPLDAALIRAIYETRSVRIAPEAWPETTLPPHLRVNFRVVDDTQGLELAQSRGLADLLAQFHPETPAASLPSVDARWHRDGLTAWDCGALPEAVEIGRAGWLITQYPALVDAGATVSLRLFPTAAEARDQHTAGVTRLLTLALGRQWRTLCSQPELPRRVADFARELPAPGSTLGTDLAWSALQRALLGDASPPRDAEAFAACLLRGQPRLAAVQAETRQLVLAILHASADRQAHCLSAAGIPDEARDDMLEQLAWLCFEGFVRHVPWAQLQEYPRYLDALRLRQERLQWNAAGDARRLAAVRPCWSRYRDLVQKPLPASVDRAALTEYRWLVEELRVSAFAQELRTPTPVSAKRLDALWDRVVGGSSALAGGKSSHRST